MDSDQRTYRIHHMCLSNNHRFKIDDGIDKVFYNVHSSSMPVFQTLLICNASTGKKLIKIYEETFQIHRRYDILAVNEEDDKEQHLATVKKVHGEHHLENIFEAQSSYGVYHAKCVGAMQGHEFKLTKGDRTVANVTKDTNHPKAGYTYHVDISNDDGGDLFLLSIIIAIWHAQRLHPI